MKKSARGIIRFFLVFLFSCLPVFLILAGPVLAQGSPGLGGGTPGTNWVQDPQVTELGKNAERARQLLFWVFSHPPIYTASVLGQMWSLTRNIAYAFVVLTIIGLAAHLVLSRKNIGPTFSGISLGYDVNINLVSIILRVAGVLLFITFSYLIVLGLIQFAEIMMRFFIEHVGGCDLFNIKFAGGGSKCIFNPSDPNYQQAVMEMEKNYTEFVGYRDTNAANLEMVNTSFFLIRLTTLTYNVISAILILRQVILWFLLIVSPFLALLLPFIFIRNTGWIWIGEFFRWLFYGPLTALFIASLSKIWKAGIPYAFDFSRVNKPFGQIYPTSINILYGGPAQTLSQTNSANYVDTYAEYLISLIMLWAAIFLPWLLLRIFRDYCCDILKENQATLLQILERLRGGPPPPPPPPEKPAPAAAGRRALDLPFRKKVAAPERLTKEIIMEKIKEREVEKVETRELARAMNLAVSSLQDVARLETNRHIKTQVKTNLEKIQNPHVIADSQERRTYLTLRRELFTRAARGDQVARRIVQATTPRISQVLRVTPQASPQTLRKAVEKPGAPVVIPQIMRVPTARAPAATPAVVNTISQKAQLPQDKVEKILKTLPTVAGTEEEKVRLISQKTQVSQEKVKEVLKTIPTLAPPPAAPAAPPSVTVEDYEEVKTMWVNHYREAEVPVSEKIKTRQDWLEEDIRTLTNTLNLLISQVEEDKKRGMEEVANILPFLLLGGFSDLEILTYLKAKLEAAKQVQEELEKIEKAKEEAKKEEEEKVKVPIEKKKEEEKKMEAQAAREAEIPEKESKNNV